MKDNLRFESKKERVSIVIKPTTKEKIYLLAELNCVSVNELISSLLDNYVKKNEVLIERLAKAKKDFDSARRKLLEEAQV